MKLNDLDLNKLHVFRVVAESASMREAAARLLRTPSAVSQSVTGLERALGVKLFARKGIRLELTEHGRRILRVVRGNERELSRLLDEVRARPARVRGRVTLGLPPGYPAMSLPLGAALLEHDELQLRLRFFSHARLAEGLRAGQLDLALSLQPLSRFDRRLQSRKLREERLVLVAPPRHRALLAGAPAGSSSGDELPVVDYYQSPLLIEGWLKHHRRGKGARARIRAYGSNLDHVLQLVLQGVGCAVVPRHVVAAALESGELLEHSWDRKRPWLAGVWLNAAGAREALAPGARAVWDGLVAAAVTPP